MVSLKERLTEILITNKLLTEENLSLALKIQKEKGGQLSKILVQSNYIKEGDLVSALSEGLGMPIIDLSRFKIDPEVVKIISGDIAKHYQLIPISKMAKILTLAMADPLNIFAIDDVKALTGYDINPIIAKPKDIADTLNQYYPEVAYDAIEKILKGMSESKIEVIKAKKEEFLGESDLLRISQDAPAIKITNLILQGAIKEKASDILIEPLEKTMRVRFRIDGILREKEAPPKNLHASLVSRIKVISNLDISEHRLPQDGRFNLKVPAGSSEGAVPNYRLVDFRVSVLPSTFGEKVALRILDKSQATLDIDALGFNKESLQSLKKCASRPHGMILVCGPTGSGKTTTLYSVLKFIDRPQKNIITVEDPVEYQLKGINQVTVRPEVGLTFAAALRSILRQDPNIIMVGEIRDFDTVDIAIKSALTGHLVLSTLHTTTSAGSIVRLINMGVEPFLIASSVISILSQRLLRVVCAKCRQDYTLDQEAAKRLYIKTDKPLVFYRGKGCKDCFQTGYSGRSAIVEHLVLTSKIKELILSRAQEHKIKAQARLEGMCTLRETGLEKALTGVTSLEEVLRVTAPDEAETNG